MSKEKNKNQPFFSNKTKKTAALICLGAAVLFLILWQIFPMEFYSLFFASIIGSNLLLILLSVIITIPFDLISSKALGAEVSMTAELIVNAVFMLTFIYLYSIFKYSAVYLPILAVVLHAAVLSAVFIRCRGSASKIKAAVSGAVSALLSDSVYLLLFTALLEVFRED